MAMLTQMRENVGSWIIKILLGAIVVVFVLWGVGPEQKGSNTTVATVDGEPIGYMEFSRTYQKEDYRDKVVVGLDLPEGKKSLRVKGFFGDGTTLHDAYSDTDAVVKNGRVELDTPYDTALLEALQ